MVHNIVLSLGSRHTGWLAASHSSINLALPNQFTCVHAHALEGQVHQHQEYILSDSGKLQEHNYNIINSGSVV